MRNMYVLISIPWQAIGTDYWDGYYTGKIYNMNKETYACVNTDIHNAKIYTNYKRALNAAEKLNNKVINYEFIVEEYKDEILK